MSHHRTSRSNTTLKIVLLVIFLMGIAAGVIVTLLVSIFIKKPKTTSAVPQIVVEEDVESMQEQSKVLSQDADTREALRAMLENGDSIVKALRTLYPEELVIVNSGKYHFVPINRELKLHDLKQENIVWINDKELQYQEAGTVVSHKGIDVSKYQGAIDWAKVKQSGVEFAFIRAGIRGYETGKIVPDENFYQNAVSASEQGIGVGAYMFSQAVNAEEAVEEAELVIQSLSGNEIAYPIVYDLEYIKSESGRMRNLSKEEITVICRAFCDHVKEAGYTPMIYGNIETFGLMLNMEQVEDIDKWFASYSSELYFPYQFSIWQYTQKGRVDGIEGDVDMNIRFE